MYHEFFGMGGVETGLRQYVNGRTGERLPGLSEKSLAMLDRQVDELIEQQRKRAADILRENKALLVTLRDLLLEKKVLDAKTLAGVAGVPASQTKSEPIANAKKG